MGPWEIVFFASLLLYQVGLLVERYRRPVWLNYLLLPAGLGLLLTFGLETVHWKSLWLPDWELTNFRWPLIPAATLWLTQTVYVIFSLKDLRGLPPGNGWVYTLKGILRTLGASGLLFAALGSLALGLVFPYRLPSPTGPLPVTTKTYHFANDLAAGWEALIAAPDTREARSWYGLVLDPGPGDSPANQRWLAQTLAARGWLVVVLSRVDSSAKPLALWPFNGRSVAQEFIDPVQTQEAATSPRWDPAWADTATQLLGNLQAGSLPGLERLADRVKTGRWGLLSFGAEPDVGWLAAHPAFKAGLMVRWQPAAKPQHPALMAFSWDNVRRADLNDRAFLAPYLVFSGLRSRWDQQPLESLARFAEAWFSWQVMGAEKALLDDLGPALPGLNLIQGGPAGN